MAAGITGPEYRRTRTILRWITGGVLAAALAAGWFGLVALRGDGNPWDTLFAEWELLRADWHPAVDEGPLPWTLNVARLLLPIAGTAFLALLTVDVATLLRSLSRNHVIVVGRGVAATTMAARLRTNGGSAGKRKVYEVETGDEGTLRASGLRRAGTLVVCGDDGNDAATNVATTRTAIGVARRRGFTAHVLVGDPGLALALRARRLVQPDNDRRQVRVANLEELAARQHMRQSTFDDQANPHLLVVGASTFGRAVIVEYARRRWAAGATGERAPVTLVGPRARRAVREIIDRWPFVAR
ncbi:MAG TPA: hypothetical protein VNA11_05315, partial [Pseudonocardia sp.]|nr:hypothetical protein [Pseudonocardia sp.]